jgi:hypothetical protein
MQTKAIYPNLTENQSEIRMIRPENYSAGSSNNCAVCGTILSGIVLVSITIGMCVILAINMINETKTTGTVELIQFLYLANWLWLIVDSIMQWCTMNATNFNGVRIYSYFSIVCHTLLFTPTVMAAVGIITQLFHQKLPIFDIILMICFIAQPVVYYIAVGSFLTYNPKATTVYYVPVQSKDDTQKEMMSGVNQPLFIQLN